MKLMCILTGMNQTMLTYHVCIHIVLSVTLALLLHEYWTVWHSWKTSNLSHQPGGVDMLSIRHERSLNIQAQGSSELPVVSSVWCFGNHHTNRMCYFHNLCYLPDVDEFVFLHGNRSAYVGLPDSRYDPALLDMSSVRDHNTQYFNFMDADAAKMQSLVDGAVFIRHTSLLFRRFHPDNLMHVLHDDLLPLFYTISTLPFAQNIGWNNLINFDLQVVFMEGWDPGPFEELYGMFSSVKPMYKSNLLSVDYPTCFLEAYVGISKYTTWYQYGFVEPQGPVENVRVTADDVHHFSHFVRMQLDVKESVSNDERMIVLLSRRYNRLILNEIDLTFALAQNFHKKVVTVAMETHSLKDMIYFVSKASILLGMHGSLLALAMFLPPGSTIVELFPYAINPEHYTPYKTLANLRGMDVNYLAWRNMNTLKTVPHPERSWDEGGIVHLPKEQQQQIMSSTEVPLHLCCQHAEWLFRIYQDTVVDVSEIILLLQNNNRHHIDSFYFSSKQLSPSHVRNITCTGVSLVHGLPSLQLSWDPPANIRFMNFVEVKYEVWIQREGEDDYTAWMLTQYQYTFTAGIQPDTNYYVWIRCLVDGTVGPFNTNHVFCST